ncbi:hypothetical protein D3C75_1128780 [compost metagenome]
MGDGEMVAIADDDPVVDITEHSLLGRRLVEAITDEIGKHLIGTVDEQCGGMALRQALLP